MVKGLLGSYGGRAGFSNLAGGSIGARAGNMPVPGFL